MKIIKLKYIKEILPYICLFILVIITIIQSSLLPYSNEALVGNVYYIGVFIRVVMLILLLLERKVKKKDIGIILCFFAVSFLSYMGSGGLTFFDLFYIPTIYRNRLNYYKVVNVFFYSILLGVLLIFALYFIGYFPAFSIYRFETGTIRNSYGFSHPNVIGRFIFYLSLLWVLKRRDKVGLIDLCGIIFVAYWVYIYPNSITSCLMILIIAVGIMISKIYNYTRNKEIASNPLIKWGSIIILPLVFLFVFYNIINASQDSSSILNDFSANFYSRFWGGLSAIKRYPIKMFGNRMTFVTSVQRFFGNTEQYFTIDCLYVLLPVRYGVICTIYFTLYLFAAIKETVKKKDSYLLIALIIMVIYSIAENGLVILYSSFVFMLPFANMCGDENGSYVSNKKYKA